MKYIIVSTYILFIFILEFFLNPVFARTGMWVVRDRLTTPAQIDSVIEYAKAKNISDIFVQVRGRGRVLFKSQYEAMEFGITTFDPLGYIIEKTQNTDIKIHAWVNVYLIWSRDRKPEEPNHPFNRFKDYILSDVHNNQLDEIYTNYIKKRKVEGYYLSPAEPQVHNYLLNLFKELVMKYKINGVHFDYFRYPSNKFIMDMKFLNYLSNRYHFKLTVDSNREMSLLLARPISEFLSSYRSWLQSYYPEVELSVAVKPDPEEAVSRFFQNWSEWVKTDKVDFVCLMAYTNRMDTFRRNIFAVSTDFPEKRKLWIGLGVYNKSMPAINMQMKILREAGFENYLFFSYKYLKKF